MKNNPEKSAHKLGLTESFIFQQGFTQNIQPNVAKNGSYLK